MFYSAQTLGFYHVEIHGARRVSIVDPAWVRPKVDLVLQPGESTWVGDEQVTNTGDEPITLRNVPDMGAVPGMVEIDNPDCLIPEDVVEITSEYHAELLEGQAAGKVISCGADGFPVLVDPLPPSAEELAAMERAWRDARLLATDGIVTRHRDELEADGATTLTAEQYMELQAYRRDLRNWPQDGEFPRVELRPTEPAWLIDSV